jgi:hypothetical protein
MKIKNTQARLLRLPSGHRLIPGKVTEIPESAKTVLEASPSFASWKKLGWIKVLVEASAPVPVEVEAEEVEGLSGLSVAQAKSVIEGCDDLAMLQAWYMDDSRKSIKKAIEDRLSALVEVPEDPEG